MTNKQYAEVAPAVPLHGKMQTYTYRLPAPAAKYSQVRVPLGKHFVSGVIVDVHNKRPPARVKIKELTLLNSGQLTQEQVSFARWIAQTMQGGMGFTLKLFNPLETSTRITKPLLSRELTTPLHYTVIDHNTMRRQKYLLRLVKKILARGQQVLIIVPEKVQLSGWKDVTLRNLRTTENLVIGTQIELFAPWQHLGLIIVDEVAYETHKQWHRYPRLDSRYGARKLAELHRCPLVYSGSFAALDLKHGVAIGKVVQLLNTNYSLRTKIASSSYLDRKKRYLIPHEALSLLRGWLNKKERIFILYNRLDRSRVMKVLGAEFPRQDWSGMIGTTAAFKDLATTGIDRAMLLLPEISLRYPDFRSAERTRLLLHRLRQLLPPRRRVVVATRDLRLVEERLTLPEQEFVAAETKDRQRFSYPPYTDLIKLTFQGLSKKRAFSKAVTARKEIETRYHRVDGNGEDKVIWQGPFTDLRSQRGKKHEAHVLLRGRLSDLIPLYDDLKADVIDLNPERIL